MTYDYNLHITLSKREVKILNDILSKVVPQNNEEEWLVNSMIDMVREYIVERK